MKKLHAPPARHLDGGRQTESLAPCALPIEQLLEGMIVVVPEMLSGEWWMMTGRQDNGAA
jgi:hypothetical protein